METLVHFQLEDVYQNESEHTKDCADPSDSEQSALELLHLPLSRQSLPQVVDVPDFSVTHGSH